MSSHTIDSTDHQRIDSQLHHLTETTATAHPPNTTPVTQTNSSKNLGTRYTVPTRQTPKENSGYGNGGWRSLTWRRRPPAESVAGR